MRYWLLENDAVIGPYDPWELARRPSYSEDSLVCPEGRRGDEPGAWQPAGKIPGLPSSLLTPPASPPETSLRSIIMLGNLQEKVTVQGNTILQLQEGMRRKELELAGLHQDLEQKAGAAIANEPTLKEIIRHGNLSEKVAELEKAVMQLQENLLGKEADIAILRRELEATAAAAAQLAQTWARLEEPAETIAQLRADRNRVAEAQAQAWNQAQAEREKFAAVAEEVARLQTELQHLRGHRHRPGLPPPSPPDRPRWLLWVLIAAGAAAAALAVYLASQRRPDETAHIETVIERPAPASVETVITPPEPSPAALPAQAAPRETPAPLQGPTKRQLDALLSVQGKDEPQPSRPELDELLLIGEPAKKAP